MHVVYFSSKMHVVIVLFVIENLVLHHPSLAFERMKCDQNNLKKSTHNTL